MGASCSHTGVFSEAGPCLCDALDDEVGEDIKKETNCKNLCTSLIANLLQSKWKSC
eukprot:m.182102 g.182102  ORF g.182102 m.182102 type:complete len:56 (+) comp39285_c0_seq21:1363-1530(+)